MKIPCAKMCGSMVEVTKEAMQEMIEAGGDAVVVHDVCPNVDALVPHRYRIELNVFRDEEKVASVGDTVEAAVFTDAVEDIGRALNDRWAQVVGLSDIIDADDDDEPVEVPYFKTPEDKEAWERQRDIREEVKNDDST